MLLCHHGDTKLILACNPIIFFERKHKWRSIMLLDNATDNGAQEAEDRYQSRGQICLIADNIRHGSNDSATKNNN